MDGGCERKQEAEEDGNSIYMLNEVTIQRLEEPLSGLAPWVNGMTKLCFEIFTANIHDFHLLLGSDERLHDGDI